MTLQDQDSEHASWYASPDEATEPQPDPHYLELLRGSRLPQAY